MLFGAPDFKPKGVTCMRKSYPILGIMAHLNIQDGEIIGKQGPVLYKYLTAAKRYKITACVFDPADVNIDDERLLGYVLSTMPAGREMELVRVEIPIPRVIYDQIASRRYENQEHILSVREYLRSHALVFNDGFFDKWQVHAWLAQEPKLQRYLPDTALLDGTHSLVRFLKEHDVVFVKPINGSLGLGIVKLVHDEQKIKAVLKTRSGHINENQFSSGEHVYRFYKKRWLRRPHVLQEGLSLITVDERPVDIRVLLQKDRKGLWKKTKMYVRVAAEGEFTSNLTTGGLAVPLSSLFQTQENMSLEAIERHIRRLTTQIPLALERASGRLLGELGVDLGVAQNGRLSIIEVNSKPWKAPETVHGSTQLVELSFIRPVRFAIHLAKTVDARGETLS